MAKKSTPFVTVTLLLLICMGLWAFQGHPSERPVEKPGGGPLQRTRIIGQAEQAIRKGSARELTKLFSPYAELNLAGQSPSYDKKQAEALLQRFFEQNPVLDFEYFHQGESKRGLYYAIGTYTSQQKTFRVYMLVKDYDGQQRIDMLNFGKE